MQDHCTRYFLGYIMDLMKYKPSGKSFCFLRPFIILKLTIFLLKALKYYIYNTLNKILYCIIYNFGGYYKPLNVYLDIFLYSIHISYIGTLLYVVYMNIDCIICYLRLGLVRYILNPCNYKYQ